jgi:hypothetical protein
VLLPRARPHHSQRQPPLPNSGAGEQDSWWGVVWLVRGGKGFVVVVVKIDRGLGNDGNFQPPTTQTSSSSSANCQL